ncbi:alpha/beta hydrolase [Microbacterium sp. YY-01]|uniref:alpha/beta hydrolase n=1 Tax=Microbacterium sp. YY-01 TaxID=3421634 RepID=UPI003D182854
MRPARIFTAAAAIAVAVCGAAAALGWIVARTLTAPVSGRRFDLRVHDIEHDGQRAWVVLDRTSDTTATGVYNLWFEHGGWAQLGTEIERRDSDRVARVITGMPDGLVPTPGDRVSWSGIYYATPADAGLDAHEVSIQAPAGPCPAWQVDGSSTWAIHIHGLGGTRAGTVRGVQVATELGFTSLAVSYRNDGEGPTVGTGRSTLGWTEADDVEEAIHYALRRGAERIVLFGWSMGGTIAIQLALRPHLTQQIDGLVLDSPVLDWRRAIRANCKRAGLPDFAERLAALWLQYTPLAQLLGLPNVVPIDATSFKAWAAVLTTPTLIVQGAADQSVPDSAAIELAELKPGVIELHRFDASHTVSWNRDPVAWRAAVMDWLQQANRHQ